MSTVCSSSYVYPRMHWAGGVSAGGLSTQGGVCLLGVSAKGRGVSAQEGVYPSMHWGRHPSCEQNDWQTGVKTLPFHNFISGR